MYQECVTQKKVDIDDVLLEEMVQKVCDLAPGLGHELEDVEMREI